MSAEIVVSCHTCGSALNHRTTLPAGNDGLLEALGVPLRQWHRRTGVDVLPALANAIAILDADEQHYRERFDRSDNSVNDWSRVNFVREFLPQLRDAICREPWAVIHVA